MLMKMSKMAMKTNKPKRRRMPMIKELIEVVTEVEDDVIKDKRWSIRKKERPHNQMGRPLSSKVEQRLLSTKRRNPHQLQLLHSQVMEQKVQAKRDTRHMETMMVNRMKVKAKEARMMSMVMSTMTRMVPQTRTRRITKSSKTKRSSFDRQTLPSKSSAKKTREYATKNTRSLQRRRLEKMQLTEMTRRESKSTKPRRNRREISVIEKNGRKKPKRKGKRSWPNRRKETKKIERKTRLKPKRRKRKS